MTKKALHILAGRLPGKIWEKHGLTRIYIEYKCIFSGAWYAEFINDEYKIKYNIDETKHPYLLTSRYIANTKKHLSSLVKVALEQLMLDIEAEKEAEKSTPQSILAETLGDLSIAEAMDPLDAILAQVEVLHRLQYSTAILAPSQYTGGSRFLCAVHKGVALAAIKLEGCSIVINEHQRILEAHRLLKVMYPTLPIVEIQTSLGEFFTEEKYIKFFNLYEKFNIPLTSGLVKNIWKIS